jgi:NAD kinase
MGLFLYDKLVLVTLKTRLEELIERFNTREQARFYLEHMGLNFADYQNEHDVYHEAVRHVRHALEGVLPKMQVIERSFLPNFQFTRQDVIVTVGRDGLVVNTAKYLNGQPIVAVNPDPSRIDGLLLPFDVATARIGVDKVLRFEDSYHNITMAEVRLNDGQHLLAFNDFYLGQRTHLSSRYKITYRGTTEKHSSSGMLVITGVGSTGWFSSTQNMADAVNHLLLGEQAPPLPRMRLAWDDRRLVFVVREPFQSKASAVELAAGMIEPGEVLTVESNMPDNGVIFSDGIEADALAFNSGAVATIQASDRVTRLVA